MRDLKLSGLLLVIINVEGTQLARSQPRVQQRKQNRLVAVDQRAMQLEFGAISGVHVHGLHTGF